MCNLTKQMIAVLLCSELCHALKQTFNLTLLNDCGGCSNLEALSHASDNLFC
jgi:hypothetical protein